MQKKLENFNKKLDFNIKDLSKPKEIDEFLFKCLSLEKQKKADFKVLNNIGLIYFSKEKYDLATHYFIKSLQVKTSCDAYINLANVHFNKQNHDKSFHYYMLAYRENSNKTLNNSNFKFYLKKIRYQEYSNEIENIYITILKKKNFVRPRDFMNSIISLLIKKKEFKKIVMDFIANDISKDIVSKLSKESLFIKSLELMPIADLKFEKFLRLLRKFLLLERNKLVLNEATKKVLEALSLQCFNTDYLYIIDQNEELILKDLNSKKICDDFNSNQLIINIALLSCYIPLLNNKWIEKTNFKHVFKKIYKTQISNCKKEKKIAKNIFNFSKIKDKTSKIVKTNYEYSPYPRYSNLSLFTKKYESINEFCLRNDLRIKNILDINQKKINLLVAGCGTGQDALEISSLFYNSQIVGIDLSKKSLSYAIRKKKELKITNVNFYQGDLLETSKLNTMFDIIHCHGVLNHIKNPYMGLKALTQSLKNQGLLFLSLYSKVARKDIFELRTKLLTKYKFISDDIVKKIRLEIINDARINKKTFLNSVEFYNMNEFKDMLLHPQEYCFTFEEIEGFIMKLNLEFCGFVGLQNEKNKFVQLYGNNEKLLNLKLWKQFENDYPKTFLGMYHFCLQKNS